MDKDKDPAKPSWDSPKPQGSDFDEDDSGITPAGSRRREPVFTDFDEQESYEEPDRDTDYASAYEEEEIEADELDDFEPDDTAATAWELAGAERELLEPDAGNEDVALAQGERANEDEADVESEYEDDDYDTEDGWDDQGTDTDDDNESDWDDPDQENTALLETHNEDHGAPGWPIGLIAVALVALFLLAAGGYGVIQQRSAMQEEIVELQALLATAASPADVAASREALREIEIRSRDQDAEIRVLNQENTRLNDMVAGLEVQLKAQQEALSKPPKPAPAAPKPAKPVAKSPAKAPAAKASPTATASGGWFVNFGSYNSRAIAQDWAKRLQPAAGKVTVSSATKGGDTFYRVRVSGLGSRDEAERISRKLEAKYSLPKLWVGSE